MGQTKSLLPLGGKPVLAHVIETILAAQWIAPVIVVTGHEPAMLEPVVSGYATVERVHNENHERGGMLSSIQAGLAAIDGRADAVFVVLGDQPLVRAGTLRTMISAYRARRPRVIVPSHEGRRGHPILLCARGVSDILALPPNATLKTYTDLHADHRVELPVSDPAVLQDLDTPADYAAAVARFAELYDRTGEHDADDVKRSQACPNRQTVPQPTAG
jgi:molybdenum cofactor cytidylyltransferase